MTSQIAEDPAPLPLNDGDPFIVDTTDQGGQQGSARLAEARRSLARHASPRGFLLLGVSTLCAIVASGAVWSATAPIGGAAIAPGTFVVRGQNKTIQHLEGGIVDAILVEEGQRVKKGDDLVALNPTQSEVTLARLRAERDTLVAREARLVAERDGQDRISFPPPLLEEASRQKGLSLVLADQQKEFNARLALFEAEAEALKQKMKALDAEIVGYEAQISSAQRQLELLKQEHDLVEGLFQKGLATQDRLLALKRRSAELEGTHGTAVASIAKSEQTILETQQQLQRLVAERVSGAATDLVETRVDRAKTEHEMRAAADVLTRISVKAPIDGVVVKLHVHTVGGVISAGQNIVDLLPLPADLVIEARVDPLDINRVHPGQAANIRIPALHLPYSPTMPAKVEYVSADRLTDADTGEDYYLARIGQIVLPHDVAADAIYPGIKAEVFVANEPRTIARYLLEPLIQSYNRSMREH